MNVDNLRDNREMRLIKAVERLADSHEKQAEHTALLGAHINNLVAALTALSKKSLFETVFGK